MHNQQTRQSVLESRRLSGEVHSQVCLRLRPPLTQFIFRGGAEAASKAEAAFGLSLPRQVCRAAQLHDRSALWLGPDEWLLFAPEELEDMLTDSFGDSLGDTGHALVSVGHRNVLSEVEGNRAERLLNSGCPLDLDETVFPIGMCTRTAYAKTQIILWRTDTKSFTLFVWRSFATYLWDSLLEARERL